MTGTVKACHVSADEDSYYNFVRFRMGTDEVPKDWVTDIPSFTGKLAIGSDSEGNPMSWDVDDNWGSQWSQVQINGDWHMVTDALHFHTGSTSSAIPDTGEAMGEPGSHIDETVVDSLDGLGLPFPGPITSSSDVLFKKCRQDGTRLSDV